MIQLGGDPLADDHDELAIRVPRPGCEHTASGSRPTSTAPGAAQFADALAAFIAVPSTVSGRTVGHSFGAMVAALSLFQCYPAAPASQ